MPHALRARRTKMEGECMKRLRNAAIFLVALPLLACTSSNTPTTAQSNAGYDSEYRESTRSAQQYGEGAGKEQPLVEPAPTLMLIGAETGEMNPGEDYYIYAVADNPDKRNLQYVWSLQGGTVSEVPEAERGRLDIEVAKAKEDALNPPVAEQPLAPAAPAAAPAAPAAAAAAPAAGAQPVQPQAPVSPAAASGAPQSQMNTGAQAPAGAGLPGTQPANQNYSLGGGGGGAPASGTPAAGGGGGGAGANISPSGGNVTPPSGTVNPSATMGTSSVNGDGKSTSSTKHRQQSKVFELRMIMGPEQPEDFADMVAPQQIGSETAQGVNEGLTRAKEAAGGEAQEVSSEETREEPAGEVNAAEREMPENMAPAAVEESPSRIGERSQDIRSEYQAWDEEGTGGKREQALGGYGEETAENAEPLTAEKSYELVTLVTEDPYIVWTPDRPGKFQLFCKLAWKDEDMTEARELDLEVRLKDPAVELSQDFPDVVREDDAIFVRLDSSQLPAFDKGLFTVTYDINKLSFRGAELGEFFDDDPAASIYYAQPDKTEGKVLIAIDSNTEVTELSGDGTLAYLKFTAKTDIETQADTQLALVADTAARYILDKDGENILPLPVTRPPYKTEAIIPAPSSAPATPGVREEAKPGQFANYPDVLTRDQAEDIAGSYNISDDALGKMLDRGDIKGAHRTGTDPNSPWAIPKDVLIQALEAEQKKLLAAGQGAGTGPAPAQKPVPGSEEMVGPLPPAVPPHDEQPAQPDLNVIK